MTTLRHASEERTQPLSRRALLRAGAAGVAAAALGSTEIRHDGMAHQTDQPPTASDPETVAAVAARLGYDTGAIFAFVRDEIRYETYAGVLRGAKGTLWARAGNSADQAMLLAELLAISQVRYRFATTPLDADRESSLTALLTPTLEEAQAQFQGLIATWGEILGGDSSEPLNTEDEALLEQLQASAENAIALGTATTETVHTMVRDALADAGIELPDLPAVAIVERERTRHTWIQVPDGGSWLDLDPTIPDSEIVTNSVAPAETFEALPDDWHHQVTYRVVAEELSQGDLVRRDAVTFARPAFAIFDVPVGLSLVSSDPAGVAGTVGQLYSDQITVSPSFYAAGEITAASQPMVFAKDGASALGVFESLGGDEPAQGALDGETIAALLVVEITSPDAGPVSIERVLLDRVPATDRLNGTFDPVTIPPAQTVPDDLFEDLIAGFDGLTVLHVDIARIPGMYAIARTLEGDPFGEIGVLGPSLGFLRDGMGVAEEGAFGYWSYPSVPNVTAITVTPAAPGAEDERIRLAADLIHRHRTTLPLSDVNQIADVHPQVLSGILDTVAERVLLAPETRSLGDPAAAGSIAEAPSIGAVFMQADEEDVGIRVLQSAADLMQVSIGPSSGILMTRSLDSGAILVAPAQPVELDGAELYGWWVVDPATGHTFDQFPDGRGSASTLIPGRQTRFLAQGITEYIYRWVEKYREHLTCIGNIISWTSGVAGVLWHGSVSGGYTFGHWMTLSGLGGLWLRSLSGCFRAFADTSPKGDSR